MDCRVILFLLQGQDFIITLRSTVSPVNKDLLSINHGSSVTQEEYHRIHNFIEFRNPSQWRSCHDPILHREANSFLEEWFRNWSDDDNGVDAIDSNVLWAQFHGHALGQHINCGFCQIIHD